jgi:hypothetical protein
MSNGDRRRQLAETIEVLSALIRNIALKKALHRTCAEPHLNFWRVLYGNQMDMAVIEWCKLFGSDDTDRQPTHWKNVVADQDVFRTDLLAAVGKSESEWRDYWLSMKRYRNMFVAHHDDRRRAIANYPLLDSALASGCFYYDYIREELGKLGLDQEPSDIRRYARDFENQCAEVAAAAMAATREIEEKVM